jgi:hypothetical protein
MASIPVILHKYRQLEKEHLSEEEGLSSLAFGFSVIDTTPHEDE